MDGGTVYTTDLKSFAARLEGSNPSPSTEVTLEIMTNKTYAVKKDGLFYIAVDRGPEHGWRVLHVDEKHFYKGGRLYVFADPITNPPGDLQEWSEIFVRADRSLAIQGQEELTWVNFDQIPGNKGTLITTLKPKG